MLVSFHLRQLDRSDRCQISVKAWCELNSYHQLTEPKRPWSLDSLASSECENHLIENWILRLLESRLCRLQRLQNG